ncbi:MAG: ribbon-helix-helix domain-containing protein [Pseudomonadota bacterium]
MNERPKKHSLTLKGHRTSVSLEDEFWDAFCDIAKEKGIGINALSSAIDAERGEISGLASAIRVFVLNHYRGVKER